MAAFVGSLRAVFGGAPAGVVRRPTVCGSFGVGEELLGACCLLRLCRGSCSKTALSCADRNEAALRLGGEGDLLRGLALSLRVRLGRL